MKIEKAPLWIKIAVFFAITILPGIDCNAGTMGKPVKQLNMRDLVKASIAVARCKPEAEVADIVVVELVSVTVDGKTKLVYRPVKQEIENNTTKGE